MNSVKAKRKIQGGIASILMPILGWGVAAPSAAFFLASCKDVINTDYQDYQTGQNQIIEDELWSYESSVADLERRVAAFVPSASQDLSGDKAKFNDEKDRILGWIDDLKAKYPSSFSPSQTAKADSLASRLATLGDTVSRWGIRQDVQDIIADIDALEFEIDSYKSSITPSTPQSEIDAKKAEYGGKKQLIQDKIDALAPAITTDEAALVDPKMAAIGNKITNLDDGQVVAPPVVDQLGQIAAFADIKRLANDGSSDWAQAPAGYANLRTITGTADWADMLAFMDLINGNTANANVFDTDALAVQVAMAAEAVMSSDIEKALARASKLNLSSRDAAKKMNVTSGDVPASYEVFDIARFTELLDGTQADHSDARLAFGAGTVFDRPSGFEAIVGSAASAGIPLADLNGALARAMFYNAKIGDTKLNGNVAGVETILPRELASRTIAFVAGSSFEGAMGGIYNLAATDFAELFDRTLKTYKYVDIAGSVGNIANGTSFAGARFDNVEFDVPTTNASFSGATITGTNFKQDAVGASFAGAAVSKSQFGYGIDMTGASFAGAKLNDSGAGGDTVVFDHVDLTNALFNGSATRIKNTYFSGAQLSGANFSAARLDTVDFGTLAALDGALFDGANLKNTAIGANFDMTGASFKGTAIDGLSLGRGTYGAADFTGMNGKGLSIASNSDLSTAIFENVLLSDWLRFVGGKIPANMKFLGALGLELNGAEALAGTDMSGVSLTSLKSVNPVGLANINALSGKGSCTNYEGKLADFDTHWNARLVNFQYGNRVWLTMAPMQKMFLALAENMHLMGQAKGC